MAFPISPNVTEEHPLVPLTLYNKYKGMCEPLLLKHTDEGFRRRGVPAGDGVRLRAAAAFRSSVNILTNHAINNGKITVFGGEQLRPNLHILDYCDAVQVLLDAPDEKIAERDIQRRLSRTCRSWTSRYLVKRSRPGGVSGKGRDRHRHDAERRQALLSHQFRQGAARPRLRAKRTHRGSGARPVPGLQGRPAAERMADDIYYNVRRMKNLQARMRPVRDERRIAVVTGGAGFIGSHMVDLLLARGYRVRVIDNLVGGREANLAHHNGDPRLSFERRDIRGSTPPMRCSRMPRSSSISPASATSCPRSSGRPIIWTPMSRARCACSNARARRRSKNSSMRRRRPATGWPQVPTREDHPIAPEHPYA